MCRKEEQIKLDWAGNEEWSYKEAMEMEVVV